MLPLRAAPIQCVNCGTESTRTDVFTIVTARSILSLMSDRAAIESILNEDRVFHPPPDFSTSSYIKSFEEYERIYNEAAKDVPAFWAQQAETLDWFEKWHTVLEWNEPFAKWFV